jgi:hypothetical protein
LNEAKEYAKEARQILSFGPFLDVLKKGCRVQIYAEKGMKVDREEGIF